jgi:Tfp pilus assembly protein PilV
VKVDLPRSRRSPRRASVRRSDLSAERGSILFEALISMVLLVIFALGFLGAVDTATKISGNNESRTAAAALAQEDIERVKALKIRDLANMNSTRTAAVGGTTYSITTTTQWVDDSTGTTTCPSGATRTDYLKAISVVTWPSMGTTQPVKNQTLIAVPLGTFDDATGGLIAKFIDRNGNGVPNISVSVAGPTTSTGSSDADGCAFWSGLPEGGYYINVAQPGYVDHDGNNVIHQSGTVSGGSTNSFVFSYDRAATINATFTTTVGGVPQADKATDFTVANSALASPGYDTFSVGTAASSMTSGSTLFPYSDGFVVYAGKCAGNDPRTYSQSAPLVPVAQGGTSAVSIGEPALNIIVKRGTTAAAATAYSAATVRITPMTAGCGSVFGGTGLLNSSGAFINPGQPYGDYQVCVSDGSKKVTSATIQNRAPAGTAVTTLTIVTGATGTSPTGTCP